MTLAGARRALSVLDERIAPALTSLPLFTGTLDVLTRLAVPGDETVGRFEDRARELASARTELEFGERGATGKLVEIEKGLAQLAQTGHLPDDEELLAARARRESGWALVRAGWIEGADVDEAARLFDSGLPLADAYERSVSTADQVADLRHREAERLAQHAQLVERAATARAELEEISIRQLEIEAAETAFSLDWRSAWAPTGLEPLPPGEMRAWLHGRASLVARAEERLTSSAAVEAAREDVSHFRSVLEGGLASTGLESLADDEALADGLTRASSALRRLQEANTGRETAEGIVRRLESEVAALAATATPAHEAIALWQREWEQSLGSFVLASSCTPGEALDHLSSIESLFSALDESELFRIRVDGMVRDRAAFETKAEALANGLAPDLAGREPEAVIGELNARCTRAGRASASAEILRHQMDESKGELESSDAAERKAPGRLKELLERTECHDLAELKAEEARSTRVRDLDARIESLDAQIVAAGADTVERVVAEVAETSADELEAAVPAATQTVQELEERLRAVSERIGTQQVDVDAMAGGDDAAVAAEAAQSLLAKIRRDSERYARLRVASTLLQQAIERHREESQGPVVRRVGELFPVLTAGSFEGVGVDYDAHDRPVLVGRRDDAHVPVEGMSDGTRDQLYLALRIASLEKLSDTTDSPPFIADDLFVSFDDARARAGLEALSELAGHMQVVFFTHHNHLVDIARSAIPPDALHVHEMIGPAS